MIEKQIFDIILEDTLAGYWDWNIPENTEYLSPTFKKMFGYEDHELPNTPETWQQLIFKEDLEEVFKCFNAHVESKGKIPYTNTVRYKHKNGSTVHVLCKGRVIEWAEDGSPIRMVGSHVEVTDIVATGNQLEESNETLNLIIKGTSTGIWNWNIKTGEEWWSEKFYNLLGYKEKEITASYDTFINHLLHPDDKQKTEAAVAAHLEDKVPYKINIRMLHKNGTYRWYEAAGQAKWNEEGEPIRMAGSIVDIHENKLKAIALEESNDMITEQNGRLLNFAHIVSHNLRSYSGNLSSLLMLWDISTETERKDLLANINNVSTQLTQTIDYLNEVVSINTRAKAATKPVVLSEQFDHVLKIVANDIKQSNATIDINFDKCNEIEYVPAYIESILLNFTTNAIKYRHKERPLLIKVSSTIKSNKPVIIFEDNGLGIDLDKYGKKLFGMYKTFHGNQDAKGIGLFMTKNQVESLGGKIEVESEVNKGTTFKIYL